MLREELAMSNCTDGYIEHRVSKLDTLVGLAIKYGVEVADIKRANGLVTDLQMFAHNTLKIPIAIRHPPSISVQKQDLGTLGSSASPKQKIQSMNCQMSSTENLESRYRGKRPLSSAMNLLRGYYGLSSPAQQTIAGMEGMEMTAFRSDSEDHSEDEPYSPIMKAVVTLEDECNVFESGSQNTPASRRTKESSRLVNGYTSMAEVVLKIDMGDNDKSNESSVRRRQKGETTSVINCAYAIEKQDIAFLDRMLPSSVFPSVTESSGGRTTGIPKIFDGTLAGGKGKEASTSKVGKSSSTSNLQEQTVFVVNSGGSNQGTMINAKSASQTNLNQASSRPLFEGLSKPITHRYKAALD